LTATALDSPIARQRQIDYVVGMADLPKKPMGGIDPTTIVAVLLGNSLRFLILILAAVSLAIDIANRVNATGFIPPLILKLAFWGVAIGAGSVPWIIPFLPVLRWKRPKEKTIDSEPN
jgi:hypothetical protein